ncbi:hypothetical protein BDN70DRAFT_997845 [Pholiota conissans]|uniref:Uncharacterized protein n=1 Tax=Pholiota conissans TaxID=109636 RepID=A0A9P5YPJ0_9AGAR|nr:hypothetical protein BDN70DRAFT_997845 [Pholiota conissans]
MSQGTDYDDSNSGITYSSGWQAESGTISQQFDNTIHSTSANGASATIKFTGTRITVYQTTPEGIGSVTVTITFDGDTSTMSRDTHPGTSYYQDRWFDSGPLTDGVHLLTLTNAGTNGGQPLILDRFNIEGSIIAPVRQSLTTSTRSTSTPVSKPTSTTTSSSSSTTSSSTTSQRTESTSSSTTLTSTGTTSTTGSTSSTTAVTSSTQTSPVATVVSIQYVTNSADGSVSTFTNRPSSDTAIQSSHVLSVGAIIGATVGVLIIILLLIFLVFCLVRRRRGAVQLVDHEATTAKPHSPTDVSPFRLSTRGSLTSPVTEPVTHSMGLTRKGSDNSSTTHRNSLIASTTPLSSASNRERGEKSGDPFTPSSERSTDAHTFLSFLPSHNAAAPVVPGETDAGPFRPNYLSGNTIMYGSSSGMYASTTRLIPVDTNDVPPSYQSASHRASGV